MKLILGKLNNGAIFYWDISHMQLKQAVCLLKRNMIRND